MMINKCGKRTESNTSKDIKRITAEIDIRHRNKGWNKIEHKSKTPSNKGKNFMLFPIKKLVVAIEQRKF